MKTVLRQLIACLLALSLLLFASCCAAQPSSAPTSGTASEAGEDTTGEAFPVREVTDERISSLKKFRDVAYGYGFELCFPADWKCFEQHGEDGGFYDFYHPEAKDIHLRIDITGSVYFYEKTDAEYARYLNDLTEELQALYEDVTVTLTKDTLDGYACAKVVYSYTSNGEKFHALVYENVVTGARIYDFTLCYPHAQKDFYEPIFEAMMHSVRLMYQ